MWHLIPRHVLTWHCDVSSQGETLSLSELVVRLADIEEVPTRILSCVIMCHNI